MTEEYERALSHALDFVHVVAARRGWDPGQILVAIDAGRQPANYQEHTVTLSVRNANITVTAHDIPHEWFETGTGFVDGRFSQRIGILLSELEKEWGRHL
jgi:hypothetical protein